MNFMKFAPNHDYRQFEAVTEIARLELERRASPIQKAQRFAALVAICRGTNGRDVSRADRQKRWMEEKLSIRLRQIAAFNSDA